MYALSATGSRCSSLLAPLVLLAAMFATDAVSGDVVNMQGIADMRSEAQLLRSDNLILVLEFSSEYCGYCRKLENLFLLPMQRNAVYDDKILVRSISLDAFETVVDFEGRTVSTSDFASRYGVSLTPTMLFLNADGVEMSERLVGIWSEDFYGGFIDNRIEEARDRLGNIELAKTKL
jgi:thioredoxin-related protein